MSKNFKYQEDMKAIREQHNCECPAKHLKAISHMEAYRFVHEDINHKSNFLPQLKDEPARFIDNNGKKKCDYLSLSFFTKAESAKSRFSSLAKTVKNIHKTLGTHIAVGALDSNDGLKTEDCSSNHFDLYEFEEADLKNKFAIIDKL
ncbi:hypothetical protein [Mangrovibacterium sp.]|uniref:hypothetical protein n=1 Tax=Mangrovibacterium sp. TaxID=1961364 RepID=UPI0035647CD4